VVGANLSMVLQVAGSSQTVTVESSGDLVETDPTFHTDVDRELFTKVPLESESSSLSSLVTLTTPASQPTPTPLSRPGRPCLQLFFRGRPVDHRPAEQGLLHQIPADSIQSIEVISGAPPAEYGARPAW